MTEPKLVSKCCGADVTKERVWWTEDHTMRSRKEWVCLKCHKPCKVESKEGGGDE